MRRRPRTSSDSTPAARAGQRRSPGASRALTPPSRTRKPPAKAEGRAHEDTEQLRVFPSQFRPGDLVVDDQGHEWEVVRVAAYQQGKRTKYGCRSRATATRPGRISGPRTRG
jgi:hypothetical protein